MKNFFRKFFSIRACDFYAFLLCATSIVFAMYLQFGLGLRPCPLCVLQRMMIFILALFFLVGAVNRKKEIKWNRYFHFVGMCLSLIGAMIAGRHAWLQYFVKLGANTGCGPDIGYMLQNFPLWQAVKLIFAGTGDCLVIDWRLWDFSLPTWTFLFFVLCAGLCLINMFRNPG